MRESGSSYRESVSADPAQARAYLECCAREVRFYRLVAGGGAYAPRAIVAEADTDAGWIFLLLEDLSHGEPGDAVHGCSPEQAGLVLDQIATVHAAWWDDPALEALDWLPVWSGGGAAAAERLRARVNPFLDRYGDQVPASVHELLRLFASRFEAVLKPLTEPSLTVIHGDLHLDNIMFVTGDGTPAVRIIDWQGVARGPAAVDVALFLVGSLSVEARRETETELLRRYYQNLTDAGVTGYSFGQLLDHYRRALLHQLAGTVGWLSRTSPEDLEGRERELVEAILTKGQLFAALVDHQEGLLPLLRTQ